MGKAKKTRKFAAYKRMINPKTDNRIIQNSEQKVEQKDNNSARNIPQYPSHLFLNYNTQLGPPYRVLIDTNFINASIRNHIDILTGCMNLLLAKCHIIIPSCVMAEIEKLGNKYSLALNTAKDSRFERLVCNHTTSKNYADDCLIDTVTTSRCYIIATEDKDLKRRIRKIPGVPIISCKKGKGSGYKIEKLPT